MEHGTHHAEHGTHHVEHGTHHVEETSALACMLVNLRCNINLKALLAVCIFEGLCVSGILRPGLVAAQGVNKLKRSPNQFNTLIPAMK